LHKKKIQSVDVFNESGMEIEAIVFVYGTLKNGFNNHHLLASSFFLGRAVTCRDYALYSSSIPFVIRDQPVSQIHGEAYGVSHQTLNKLDDLEGHPTWYRREQIPVCLYDEKSRKEKLLVAWIYFYPNPTGQLIQDGIYR
jgi:gamma-glutamylaminecyclotransferase